MATSSSMIHALCLSVRQSACMSVCVYVCECVDCPQVSVVPPVSSPGDEVTLRCSAEYGAPHSADAESSALTADQLPQLMMRLDDVELMDSTAQYSHRGGQPGLQPHTVTRV